MKIAVLANLKEDAPVSPDDPPGRWDDLDDRITVEAIIDSLKSLGHEARYYPADVTLVQDLAYFQPELCFNWGEGHFGPSREAQTPILLEMIGIPHTGSGGLGMLLSHNKHTAKQLFRYNGLPTANFVVVENPSHIPDIHLRYPLFVKPATEGSSVGINDDAKVHNHAELERQIRWVWSVVNAPILVEEYIDGREFTISVVGNEVLPIVEVVSPTGFYSNRLKEEVNSGVYRLCPAPLAPEVSIRLQNLALKAMKILHLVDVCRMDLRMDANGNPYILEVNPLPLLFPDPEQASIVYAARAAGYTYTDLIGMILTTAVRRLGLGEHPLNLSTPVFTMPLAA
jgi:D-alanine-D-alanine ligase